MRCSWLAVLLLYAGCAFGLTGPDPSTPRSKNPNCDTSKSLVALDAVMAGTMGIVAISLAGDNAEPAVALLPASLGAIYAAGAIRGNMRVNECRKATAEYESYAGARDAAPPLASMPDDIADRATTPPPRARAALADGDEDDPSMPAQPSVQAPGMAPPPAPVAVAPATRTPAPQSPPAARPPAPQPPPAAAQPPPQPQRPPAKTPAKQAPQDDWSEFWREVE